MGRGGGGGCSAVVVRRCASHDSVLGFSNSSKNDACLTYSFHESDDTLRGLCFLAQIATDAEQTITFLPKPDAEHLHGI